MRQLGQRRLPSSSPSAGRPLHDPAAQGAEVFAVGGEPFAAAVRDEAGGLHQHQAAVRGGGEEASATRFLDDGVVIERGIEAEQR